jgi:hypothetical protein
MQTYGDLCDFAKRSEKKPITITSNIEIIEIEEVLL